MDYPGNWSGSKKDFNIYLNMKEEFKSLNVATHNVHNKI